MQSQDVAPPPNRVYKNKSDLRQSVEWLAERDKKLAEIYATYGLPDLRKLPNGFAGLVRLLISQQVSTAAARAIQAKFDNHVQDIEPHNVLAMNGEDFAACGISRPKQNYILGLAEAVASGELDLPTLHRADDGHIYNTLTAIKGIGPWTASCYLMFALRRCDVFASGDLALQAAYKLLYRKKQRPDAAQLDRLAKKWIPHRGAAARLLWLYYNEVQK